LKKPTPSHPNKKIPHRIKAFVSKKIFIIVNPVDKQIFKKGISDKDCDRDYNR